MKLILFLFAIIFSFYSCKNDCNIDDSYIYQYEFFGITTICDYNVALEYAKCSKKDLYILFCDYNSSYRAYIIGIREDEQLMSKLKMNTFALLYLDLPDNLNSSNQKKIHGKVLNSNSKKNRDLFYNYFNLKTYPVIIRVTNDGYIVSKCDANELYNNGRIIWDTIPPLSGK